MFRVPPNKLAPTSGQMQQIVEDTLRLIRDADVNLKLDPSRKDIILVIGITGSGKTTITKFLVEAETLTSYDEGFRFLIRDRDSKISEDSTIVSHTIFPELLIDPKTNTVFYDMPGFSDTRSAAIEIANAWFMKQVADHASRVKILFVASHSTVRAGENRTDFKKILEQAVEYIQNPGKFRVSMGLIVTKVESQDAPERVVAGIARFLEQARIDLSQIFSDQKQRSAASGIIEGLLGKDSAGKYNRIAYFKQPGVPGPLIRDERVMSQLPQMERLVQQSMAYVTKEKDDFGISVSADAKIATEGVARATNQSITEAVKSLSSKIESQFLQKIQSSPVQKIGTIMKEHRMFQKFVKTLNVEVDSRRELQEALQELSLSFDIDVQLGDIKKRNEYLSFFEQITGHNFHPRLLEWRHPVRSAKDNILDAITQMAACLNNLMESETTFFGTQTITVIQSRLSQAPDKAALLQDISSYISSMECIVQQLLSSKTFNEFTASVRHIVGLQPGQPTNRIIQDLEEDIELEDPESRYPSPFKLLEWVRPFEKVLQTLQSFQGQLKIDILDEKHKQDVDALKGEMSFMQQSFTQRLDAEKENLRIAQQQREEAEKGFLERLNKQEQDFRIMMEERSRQFDDQSRRINELQSMLESERKKRDREQKDNNLLKGIGTVLGFAKDVYGIYKQHDNFTPSNSQKPNQKNVNTSVYKK